MEGVVAHADHSSLDMLVELNARGARVSVDQLVDKRLERGFHLRTVHQKMRKHIRFMASGALSSKQTCLDVQGCP